MTIQAKDSLLIYSGGMDSTVLLHVRKQEIGLTLFFDYGSLHNHKEREMMLLNCDRVSIKPIIVELPFMHTFKSALLGTDEIPHGHYTDESMKKTIVPFRNGVMVSIAVAYAEAYGYNTVLIAVHAGDHAIYPDCRPSFITNMAYAIQAGTDEKVTLQAPFQNKTKRDIALLGKKHDVDFSITWSCYEGKDIHCGQCGTCVERRKALNGFDNTEYARV